LPKCTPRCTSRGQFREDPVGFRRDETDVAVLIVDLMIMKITPRDMSVMTLFDLSEIALWLGNLPITYTCCAL